MEASTEAQEKCMMQCVPTVASRPRFPLCLIQTGRFTARSATRSIDLLERAINARLPILIFQRLGADALCSLLLLNHVIQNQKNADITRQPKECEKLSLVE